MSDHPDSDVPRPPSEPAPEEKPRGVHMAVMLRFDGRDAELEAAFAARGYRVESARKSDTHWNIVACPESFAGNAEARAQELARVLFTFRHALARRPPEISASLDWGYDAGPWMPFHSALGFPLEVVRLASELNIALHVSIYGPLPEDFEERAAQRRIARESEKRSDAAPG